MEKRLLSIIFVVALFASFIVNAQTTIDISSIDEAFTTTDGGETVIDVATTASTLAAPLLSYDNPFFGESLTTAEISFDVNNYHGSDSIKVLGSLLAFYNDTIGRMYFSNGSYLGYNASAGYFDANLIDFGLGTNFIGGSMWRNVKLQFTETGFAMYVDDNLAFDQSSTNVTIGKGEGFDAQYDSVLYFIQNAPILVFGTGSWWSDNTKPDGSYWDVQYSYLKNITFTPNPDFSPEVSAVSDNNINSDVTIYSSYGHLRIENIENESDVHVYNLLGKKVFSGNRFEVENISFSTGVYIVKVTSGKTSITEKVLIKN